MQIYTSNPELKGFEHLIENEQQTVTHLLIKAGQEIAWHAVDYSVVVVPINGTLIFADENSEEKIYPGKIVQMKPHEKHRMIGLDEDSELMVVKSHLK
ncbi:cupin [Enterococcus timonensis]|uniref:cupin n=1 Tax=Enterococcus timonensis TaxID=1852364 RepID=UPI0008DA5938|nr:cupin [Enterococcus timonensis]